MINFKSIKTQLIIYLASFAVFLSIKDKDAALLYMILVSVIAACAAESLIIYLRTKRFQITESAVISGMIIGYVLSGDEPVSRFILAAALAIVSKYLIAYRKKHIFNPAAFGIFLNLIIFGAWTQWKGAYAWYITVPAGFYFAYKLRKLEIILGYAVIALALFGLQGALQKISLWHIFGYLNYFYIFVMVIEPKTTPVKKTGKLVFGAGIAALIFILTEAGVRFDVELFSLLAMNAAVPLLNNIWPNKGASL